MGEFVLKDATLHIGTSGAPVALSTYVRSVTINYMAESLEKTAMGSSGKRRIAGLKDFNVTVEFNQDLAASKVDATLWGYVGSTNKHIAIKAHSSASTAINPRYHGKVLLPSYTPIAGGVGSLAGLSVTFEGDGILTRAVAAS